MPPAFSVIAVSRFYRVTTMTTLTRLYPRLLTGPLSSANGPRARWQQDDGWSHRAPDPTRASRSTRPFLRLIRTTSQPIPDLVA
jgi:hypothetical protein